jgi:hypothetical protein
MPIVNVLPDRSLVVTVTEERAAELLAAGHVIDNDGELFLTFDGAGWLLGKVDEEPNPFCSNRSEAGDACGECPGCVAEVKRLRQQ